MSANAAVLRHRAIAVEAERRRRRVARPLLPFAEWLREVRPEFRWDYAHLVAMRGVLSRMDAGEVRRAYFSIPIRHFKTEHNTILRTAWRLEENPRRRVLLGSYSQRQAEKFSREIRRLIRQRGRVVLSDDRDAAGEWETAQGGGVRAVGAGAGVASVNADDIVIDDPIGSRDEAESPAHRDRVWDWLTNDILARCEPHTTVTLTMSRWHQDDVAGRLLDRQRDRWTVLDLPAEAEEGDPLGRAVGAPLCPELRGREWLAEKRAELGEYGFASLLQGRPRPRAGGMFKWADWQLLDAVPAVGPMVRFWDTAGTDADTSDDPDYTVGALLCRLADGRTAVVDIARFRHAPARRDAEIAAVAVQDAQRYAGRVRWRFEQEAGVGGRDRTAHLLRLVQNAGIPASAEPATGKKEVRADPLASAVGAGNVWLCPGAWRDPLRAEAADFPRGTHDDQVDAVSGAFNALAQPTPTLTFSTW